jgi:hypothetical protein
MQCSAVKNQQPACRFEILPWFDASFRAVTLKGQKRMNPPQSLSNKKQNRVSRRMLHFKEVSEGVKSSWWVHLVSLAL